MSYMQSYAELRISTWMKIKETDECSDWFQNLHRHCKYITEGLIKFSGINIFTVLKGGIDYMIIPFDNQNLVDTVQCRTYVSKSGENIVSRCQSGRRIQHLRIIYPKFFVEPS